MEDKPIIFIDSNYWIYLFDQTTKEHSYVKNHFDEIFSNFKFAVNVVVMIEVMHYLVKRLGVTIAKKSGKYFLRLISLLEI